MLLRHRGWRLGPVIAALKPPHQATAITVDAICSSTAIMVAFDMRLLCPVMVGLAMVALALALAGCGETRTSQNGGLAPPVYSESMDEVFDAVVAVFHTKFSRLESADRMSYTASGIETNWPGGDTTITVTLAKVQQGTEVNVDAVSGPTSSPGWNKHDRDFHNFIRWLDEELQVRRSAPPRAPAALSAEDRLLELDQLHAKGLVTDDEYQAKRKAIIDGL